MIIGEIGEGVNSTRSNGLLSLGGKDMFFQLLVKELVYQDPMEPMSNREFVAQLVEFSSLEQLNTLNLQTSKIFQAQVLYQGSQMLGREVVGFNPYTGEEVRGKVEEVCFMKGEVYFLVNGTYLPLTSIKAVSG